MVYFTKMNKKLIWGIIIVIILLVLWVLSGTKKQFESQVPEPFAIALNELNKSGQSGTAMFKEVKGKATVVITLNNQPKDTEEPANIYFGSCQEPQHAKYSLHPVKDGFSETILDVPLSRILSELPLSLFVHKSEEELQNYVACGEIIKPDNQDTETK